MFFVNHFRVFVVNKKIKRGNLRALVKIFKVTSAVTSGRARVNIWGVRKSSQSKFELAKVAIYLAQWNFVSVLFDSIIFRKKQLYLLLRHCNYFIKLKGRLIIIYDFTIKVPVPKYTLFFYNFIRKILKYCRKFIKNLIFL